MDQLAAPLWRWMPCSCNPAGQVEGSTNTGPSTWAIFLISDQPKPNIRWINSAARHCLALARVSQLSASSTWLLDSLTFSSFNCWWPLLLASGAPASQNSSDSCLMKPVRFRRSTSSICSQATRPRLPDLACITDIFVVSSSIAIIIRSSIVIVIMPWTDVASSFLFLSSHWGYA